MGRLNSHDSKVEGVDVVLCVTQAKCYDPITSGDPLGLKRKLSLTTLPETNIDIAPENRPKPKRKGSSSNHQFSGGVCC